MGNHLSRNSKKKKRSKSKYGGDLKSGSGVEFHDLEAAPVFVSGSGPELIRVTKPEIIRGNFQGQDYETIYNSLGPGELFEDSMFPADDYSISYDGRGENVCVKGWKRCKELYDNPVMLMDKPGKTDVNQGKLGDCWFLSSMASLSEKERLFKVVVPPGQSFKDEHYRGIFHFKFWRYGSWVSVVVDDKIPVDGSDKPVFNHSLHDGEVWPCLLEKAYAKLQGSYHHLEAGRTMSAMVDLSGGFPLRFDGRSGQALNTQGEDIFDYLSRVFRSGESDTLVCAGTIGCRPQQLPQGLLCGHAYSVFGVAHDKDRGIPKLVKLRNPWGRGEYHGPWSPQWLEKTGKIEEAKLLYCVDGEFYLPFDTFMKHFFSITFCFMLGDSFKEENAWAMWRPDKKKVEFMLRLEEDGEVFFALSQTGRRQMRDEKESAHTLLNMRLLINLAHDYDDINIHKTSFHQLRTLTDHEVLKRGNYRIIGEVEDLEEPTQCVFMRVAGNALFSLTTKEKSTCGAKK